MKLLKELCLLPFVLIVGCTVDNAVSSKANNDMSEVEPVLITDESKDLSLSTTKEDYSISNSEHSYSPFFAYDSSGMDDVTTETGISGKLVMIGDCLLFEQIEGLSTPIFPSEESQWDEVNQRMIVNGVAIPLGKNFSVTGGIVEDRNLISFKKLGDPKCSESGSFASIWTNPSVD